MPPRLPKTLQKYVDFLAAAREPQEWHAIIQACTPGRNFFWAARRRGLVRNVVPEYARGDVYTGPRMPKYELTEKGRGYVTPKPPRPYRGLTSMMTLRAAMHHFGESDPYRADHLRRGGHF